QAGGGYGQHRGPVEEPRTLLPQPAGRVEVDHLAGEHAGQGRRVIAHRRPKAGLSLQERLREGFPADADRRDDTATGDGDPAQRAHRRCAVHSSLPSIRMALFPPKAKALFWATLTSASRARLGTQSSAHSGSGSTE